MYVLSLSLSRFLSLSLSVSNWVVIKVSNQGSISVFKFIKLVKCKMLKTYLIHESFFLV